METDKSVENFKAELSALMNKYNATLESYDQYDGAEEYCGTRYVFHLGNSGFEFTLEEVLKALRYEG